MLSSSFKSDSDIVENSIFELHILAEGDFEVSYVPQMKKENERKQMNYWFARNNYYGYGYGT